MARSGGLKPDIPKNIVKGIFSSPERLQLDIKFKDYQKLVEKRKEALKNNVLITKTDDYVKGVLSNNLNRYDVRLRLKGDYIDHIVSNQWSFRVKVSNNKSIYGMRKFSLRAPRQEAIFMNGSTTNCLKKKIFLA